LNIRPLKRELSVLAYNLIVLDVDSLSLLMFLENFWTTSSFKKDTKYIFRTRAENEYGLSAYSNTSVEYEFQSYTAIVWSILPILFVAGIGGLLIIVVCGKRYVSLVHKIVNSAIYIYL
jgi:hypothetical protein